jgi:hypothetical protein
MSGNSTTIGSERRFDQSNQNAAVAQLRVSVNIADCRARSSSAAEFPGARNRRLS